MEDSHSLPTPAQTHCSQQGSLNNDWLDWECLLGKIKAVKCQGRTVFDRTLR